MYTDAEITTTHRKEIMSTPPVKILNFTKARYVEVENDPRYGVVRLYRSAEGMSFQHDMTPDQARHMAAALIVHADAVEDEAAAKSTPATV